jgi:cytoskeletal protein CcmA (bactofilin family)
VDTGKSVIGNDLKILGHGLKIISQGVLQIDGQIGGDVQAAEIIVGEDGEVTGMVAGARVAIRGKVLGVIVGKTVTLHASSQVEGDIHHMSFSIELGARFEGRSRRATSEADLNELTHEKTETTSHIARDLTIPDHPTGTMK